MWSGAWLSRMREPPAHQSYGSRALSVLTEFDSRRLAFLFLCGAFFAVGLVSFTDIDYWMHYKTGELIARHHAIPSTDPFSYTVEGKRWVVHEWLSTIIIYSLQNIGG